MEPLVSGTLTVLSGACSEVAVGGSGPTVLIGERISPSGRPALAEALLREDLDPIREEARVQVAAGAAVLDVNVAAPGVDEVRLLPMAVRAIQEERDVPLCLDSSRPEALAATLAVTRGRPLVSSVRADEEDLRRMMPLVAAYGTSVIGLTMTTDGIPQTARGRLGLAERIVAAAEAHGISRDRIVIDCLALAVGAERESALVTLEACRLVRSELGVNLVLGVSNVSYGLPARSVLNAAFCTLAIQAGVGSLIVDVARVRPAVLATDLLLARDEWAGRYVGAYKRGLFDIFSQQGGARG
ncbi:MAG: dihydropteroate synthase [Thermoleophilia bacterium]|nr:dihydropteroate synthase [Thermoleophilia bacterium]